MMLKRWKKNKMAIESFEIYIGGAIMGLFVGLGSALGNFLSQKYIIKRINHLEKKLRRGLRGNVKKTRKSRNQRRI